MWWTYSTSFENTNSSISSTNGRYITLHLCHTYYFLHTLNYFWLKKKTVQNPSEWSITRLQFSLDFYPELNCEFAIKSCFAAHCMNTSHFRIANLFFYVISHRLFRFVCDELNMKLWKILRLEWGTITGWKTISIHK